MAKLGTTIVLLLTIATTFACQTGANYYWRDYVGSVPYDAFSSGGKSFIAQINGRVNHPANLPGVFYTNLKRAITVEAGQRTGYGANFRILCTNEPNRFHWEFVNTRLLTETVLQKCVRGGHEAGRTLYIGRVFHQNQWKVGKVYVGGGLRLWSNPSGELYVVNDFEILMFD